jgi:myosin heavy subunit
MAQRALEHSLTRVLPTRNLRFSPYLGAVFLPAMSLYSKDAVGDLVLLETINEDEILNTLRRRYAKDLIYTNIGAVLLSVNPFKNVVGLYSDGVIQQYRGRYLYENAPHVFGLAEETYRALCSESEDQW